MELKKQKELTKLKKINIADPEKNTAKTMGLDKCVANCHHSQTMYNMVYKQ